MAIKKLGSDLDNPEFAPDIDELMDESVRDGKPKTPVGTMKKSSRREVIDDDEELTEDVETDDEEESESEDEKDTEKELEDFEKEPEEEEESESEESDEDQPVVEKHKLSAPEAKVVSLKRQMKELQRENKALREKQAAEDAKAREANLTAQYSQEGYDKDTAAHMARTLITQEAQQHKMRVLEFKVDHAAILREFPEAANDIERILERAEKSGMSPEQVIRGAYSNGRRSRA